MKFLAKSEYKQTSKKFIAALFVVFLHFSPQITSLGRIRNRYFSFWEFSNALALSADMVLIAFLAFLVDSFIERLRINWLCKFYRHLFLLALGSGILANIDSSFPSLTNDHPILLQLAWIGLVAIVAFSLGRSVTGWVRYGSNFCLIVSPLMILVLFPMFTWENWGTPSEPLKIPERSAKDPHPIFLFVFDEWSYTRSTEGGTFLPSLENLRKLSNQSFVFHHAQSPADTTYKSLPMLIYQTTEYESLPEVFVKKNQTEGVNGEGSPNGIRAASGSSFNAVQSLFTLARNYDYSTFLVGFYLPYKRLLGDQVDWISIHDDYPRGNTFFDKMWLGLFNNMRYWTDPISKDKWRILEARIFSRHWRGVNEEMQEETIKLIERCPQNTLALIHFPLPHAPFIFNADGSYRGPYRVDLRKNEDDDQDRMNNGTPQDYLRHLQFMDLQIGRFVGALRVSGKFDNAMIILTSDHSWRWENDPKYNGGIHPKQWVPLVIKMPYQQSSHLINREFSSLQLRPLIDQILKGNTNEEEMLSLVESSSTFQTSSASRKE